MDRGNRGGGASGCMGLAVRGITATDHVAGNAANKICRRSTRASKRILTPVCRFSLYHIRTNFRDMTAPLWRDKLA